MMLLYNLFPRLVGSFAQWGEWLEHIASMGFTWVYVNPFHFPGSSGSLYAVKDYRLYHPLFSVGSMDFRHPFSQLEAGDHGLRHFLAKAHRLGLQVAMDLVVNHSATDSPWVSEHPEWYRWRRTRWGHRIVHPGARDGRRRVTWGDLAQYDLRRTPATAGLRQMLSAVVTHYVAFGFDGFRCDAAWKVPTHVWKTLIAAGRRQRKDVVFLGETLGCSARDVLRIQRAGFDYVFNSFRWWDLQDRGFLEAYSRLAPSIRSIAFPESHDTERYSAVVGGARHLVLQRYALAAFFSSGVMMPLGYEFGAQRRVNVLRTLPGDLEPPHMDLREDILYVNRLKVREPILHCDARVKPLWLGEGISGFVKESGHRYAVVLAHAWGGRRAVTLRLPSSARVVYGLRSLVGGELRAELEPGEVFVAVGEG